MVRVANLSADLTANTSSFDTKLQRASSRLTRTGRSMSRDAESFNKRVSNSFRRAAQSTAALEGPLGGVAGRLSALSTVASTTGVVLGGTLLAITGFGFALGKAASVGDKFEGTFNRVQAVLKATGGAAGFSAQEIRDFSQELARGTLASVEGVEAASAKLLTFRSIAGDTFKRTLRLAQDLAATGFGSLSDNVTQLGKALEDPIRNLGALTRNGVTFSQQQKDVIKSLVETGQAAKAQGIILDALAQQVGGAGGAEGGSIAKAYDSLTQSVDNFFIALSDRTGAGTLFTEFLTRADIKIRNLKESLDPTEATLIDQLADASRDLSLLVSQSAEEFRQLKKEGKTDKQASEFIDEVINGQRLIIEGIQARIDAEKAKADAISNASKAEQLKITLEAEAGRIEKERTKTAAEREKTELRRQAKIQTTLDALRQSVEALKVENDLLNLNTVSIQDAATAREVLLLQQQLGVSEMDAEGQALDELIRRRNTLTESIKQEAALRKRVTDIIRSNKTETEKLNEELAEFNKLRGEGRLNEEEFQKAVERTTERINELDETQKELRETLDSVGEAAKDSFKEFITGAESAADAVRNLGLRLLDIALDKSISNIFGGGGGGGGDFFGDLIGSIFGGGGGGSDFFAFADGGRPPLGQASIVGERGPELFVPDTAGTIVPNDQLGGGSGGLTVFADLRGASVEAVNRLESFVAELHGSIETRAIDAVVSEKQRNPELFGV